jgi:Ribbon-helix-helix domain
MKQSVRWTLTVSSEIDRRVRRYLASAMRKGDLSAFVEDAVKVKLLQLSRKDVMGAEGMQTSGPLAEEAEADRILSTAYSQASANNVRAKDEDARAVVTGEGSYGG